MKVKIYDFKSIEKLDTFRKYIFSLIGSDNHASFSKALLKIQGENYNIAAEIQDKVLCSDEFKTIIYDSYWKDIASDYLNIETENINLIFPFFRVDLPNSYENDAKKMLLPWHQEAGYYLSQGGCNEESIVISTILHDVSENTGALQVDGENSTKLLKHNSDFMDPIGKKWLRVNCDPAQKYISMDTKFGQSVVFDFLKKHRSGMNLSNLVRLTILIRASNKLSLT